MYKVKISMSRDHLIKLVMIIVKTIFMITSTKSWITRKISLIVVMLTH